MIFISRVVYDIGHEWAESNIYWNLLKFKKNQSICWKILSCDHRQLLWSLNFILFALSLIKKNINTLRNEIFVLMFFWNFQKIQVGNLLIPFVDLSKRNTLTDVLIWTNGLRRTLKNKYFDFWFFFWFKKRGWFFFLFIVVRGLSYCYITRGIWYHPQARDMIYIAMVY